MAQARVKTPCIGVCSTGLGDRVCRGCKRFAHEVVHWNSYDESQKQLIEERLADFLSRCVRNHLQVIDAELLRAQMDGAGIRYPGDRDAYCQAYCLLKAAGSQIQDAANFGLMIDAQQQDMPLDQMRLAIDEEFFVLSDAWYERYLGAEKLA